jgi:Bacterial TSP3 repeat
LKHSLCSRDRAHGLARPRPFLLVFVVFLVLATILARESAAAPLAFPGAEGFGATVSGGRSGQVVHVTTLADSGTGSLRDAVSQGNRIVVFDVSGVIKITSQLVIAGDNVTLAGQSAPGDGIAIYGNGTSFSNRKNIIVRYLRFRQGINTGDGVKAVNITDGQNMIFDHVAVQWGRWDNFGITGTSSTVTLQNSIIGEGIDPQQFGSIIDSAQDITVAHNLWIDNESRNPKFKANGQYINNVVYDWGGGGGLIGGHSGADWYEDVINNYLIAGPAAVTGFLTFYASTDHVYQTGNLVDVNRNGQLDGRAIVPADFAGDSPPTFGTVAHNTPAVPVTVLSAADAYARVIAQAGTCQLRDGVELRLVAQLKSLGTTGAILTDETMVGGQPAIAQLTRPAGYDTDGDGMSDAWETAHGLNPKDASDGSGMNADGTTNVEAYLNSLADLACADATPTMPVVGDAGAAPPPADAAGPAVDAGATSGTDAASNDAATGGAGGAGGSAGGGGAIRDASATGPGVPTSDAASARVDAGGLASTDAGPSAAGGTGSGGCACSTGVGGPNGRWGLLPLLTGLTLVLGRRRVRRR